MKLQKHKLYVILRWDKSSAIHHVTPKHYLIILCFTKISISVTSKKIPVRSSETTENQIVCHSQVWAKSSALPRVGPGHLLCRRGADCGGVGTPLSSHDVRSHAGRSSASIYWRIIWGELAAAARFRSPRQDVWQFFFYIFIYGVFVVWLRY